jgi:dTDP-4-dehydrorhamnose 3,5-epimerase
MRVNETTLQGVLLIEPKVFRDERGAFLETFSEERYASFGIHGPFVQDNLSASRSGVLRGLHFQNPRAQGKLVGVAQGAVFDVAVDLRASSATFGKWFGTTLSAENGHQLWVPAGFAHGFLALTDGTVFLYKCTDTYAPGMEGSVLWNDPDVGIQWPLAQAGVAEPALSPKDALAPLLRDIPKDRLFH